MISALLHAQGWLPPVPLLRPSGTGAPSIALHICTTMEDAQLSTSVSTVSSPPKLTALRPAGIGNIWDVQWIREEEVGAPPQPLPHHCLQWARQGRELPGLTHADIRKWICLGGFHAILSLLTSCCQVAAIHLCAMSWAVCSVHLMLSFPSEMLGLGSKNN